MRILVIGAGGREHALAWRFAKDGHTVVCAPGNPGIARHATCIDVGALDLDALEGAATAHEIDLVVVGPEAPLVAGVADRLRARGVLVFGPSADGAQLEGSKIFSKQFFARYGIPSSDFEACATVAEADAAVDRLGGRVVVKADGLAAGKGVVVCSSADQAREAARAMLVEKRFGAAGDKIIVERRIDGQELSVMAITDGKRYEVLAQAEDHKAIFDGDQGPNTGGMGTVSPPSWASAQLLERVRREVFDPTLAGLAADGIDYRGVLYAGLMVDGSGVPWLLEYNCRFGDPETQPVMARLRGDLAEWLAGAARGELPAGRIEWDPRVAVCVVLASAGYPETSNRGVTITGVDRLDAAADVMVFHAGTAMRDGALVTDGGRVLGVTALGDTAESARRDAYAAVSAIEFDGMQFRRDIGARSAKERT